MADCPGVKPRLPRKEPAVGRNVFVPARAAATGDGRRRAWEIRWYWWCVGPAIILAWMAAAGLMAAADGRNDPRLSRLEEGSRAVLYESRAGYVPVIADTLAYIEHIKAATEDGGADASLAAATFVAAYNQARDCVTPGIRDEVAAGRLEPFVYLRTGTDVEVVDDPALTALRSTGSSW
jgi:hypothetical protein